MCISFLIATQYDRANVPPYNGNDPPPAPGSLKRSLFPTLLNEVQNKGTQGVRARYGAELPPIISIVRCPGRPVISVHDLRCFRTSCTPIGKILSMASNYANSYLVPISFWILTFPWTFYRGPRNGAFGKPCPCPRDTRHFRHFRRFTGFEQQSPCFTG